MTTDYDIKLARGIATAEMLGENSLNDLRDKYFDDVPDDDLWPNMHAVLGVTQDLPRQVAIASLTAALMHRLLADAFDIEFGAGEQVASSH